MQATTLEILEYALNKEVHKYNRLLKEPLLWRSKDYHFIN
jgi:hypothetical protein